LVNRDWKLSPKAYADTKDILQRGTIATDWKIYGKTGSSTNILAHHAKSATVNGIVS
jgi:hypothetical protein